MSAFRVLRALPRTYIPRIFSSVSQSRATFSPRYYTTSNAQFEVRYKEKLLEKAKSQGFNSIEELKESLKDAIETKKKELNKVDPLKQLEEYEKSQEIKANNGKSSDKVKTAIDPNLAKEPFKNLESYFNVDKVKNLSEQEIEYLWRAKWGKNENTLSAVIIGDVYKKMHKHIKESPSFVLPLPRKIEGGDESNSKEGMELHYIQWQYVGPNTLHCMLTTLAEFKLHNQYARPHTTLELFTNLLEDKNVVLMKGNIEADSNVQIHDTQLLLLNIQRFYGALGEESEIAKQRVKLLHDFTVGSPEFNVDALISLSQSLEN